MTLNLRAPALPAVIENAEEARLPGTYEAAKTALAACEQIDECQDWADKAEALASYARQAGDESLRRTADRIQARAVRRCGELLKQFDGRGRPEKEDGAVPKISQAEAAREAGMSERQTKTAVRVANVPAEAFEQAVESAEPPTVTRLAEQGRRPREAPAEPASAPVNGPSAVESTQGRRNPWRYWNDLRAGLEHLGQLPAPADVVRGIPPSQRAELGRRLELTITWLETFREEWSKHHG